jgi:tRNA threonylcarbamoyladenosine biosynthesis protein TsaB
MNKTIPCICSIDTSKQLQTTVSIGLSGDDHHSFVTSEGRSQTVVPAVEKALVEAHCSISCVTDYRVFQGPGSFTGLRVGACVAKTFGFLFGVKVNDKNSWDVINLLYDQDHFSQPPKKG